LIEPRVGLSKVLLPRIYIKQEELDANPAITPNDYRTINTYIRSQWIGKAQYEKSRYFRTMFHTFIHILKNTGCRPKELLALRVKDITIKNPRRWSETKQEWVDDYKASLYIYKSKTGRPRDVIVRSNGADTLLRFRSIQKGYLAKHGNRSLRPDDLVFGKPDEWMEKPYSMKYLDTEWRTIINSLDLEGNRLSSKPYTIYSLRSTFIENCIVDGIDIYTVATLCGNSVKIIQRYYDRHDVLKKAEQIQQIPRGATKPPEVEYIDYL
jgi:integrase